MVGVAQLVEPRIVIPVVVGSSPIVHPIIHGSKVLSIRVNNACAGSPSVAHRVYSPAGFGPLAQLVEQRTLNPLVVGSSPTWPTISFERLLTEGTIKACWRFAAGDCDAMADEPSKRSPLPIAEIKADHPAVDLAAALLRAFGQYGIATEKLPAEQLQQRCDQWARHLLVGSPPPGAAGVGTAISKREWDGARRFIVDASRSEQEIVNARIGDFRDMLWVFFLGLRSAFADDQSADKAVSAQLDHLKQVLAGNSLDTLRREVVDSLALLSRTLEERRSRQEAQMQQLDEQLKPLRNELISAQPALALDPMTRLYNRASI